MKYRTSLIALALLALTFTGCSKHSPDATVARSKVQDLGVIEISDSIQIHAEVSRLLESVCEPGSKNQFTAFEVRDHAVEFLTDYDSEIERFPELDGETHFEFIMADYDLSRDAVFVAYLFRPQVLELVAGRGDAFALRSFVEQELPEKVNAASESLRRRARSSASPVQIQRHLAVGWLGRNWK